MDEQKDVREKDIAGFPWQFAIIVGAVALGVLVVILRGVGLL